MSDFVTPAVRNGTTPRDPAILLYAQNIIQAPDEWTPYYTRAELLPMALAYVAEVEREQEPSS